MSESSLIRRIQWELKELIKENLDNEGIYFHIKDEDLTKVWVVITGTEGTPYANCPFFFEFEFPELYPMEPPMCKFCTGDGKTRFNPNLYVEGKVCLSILGTWDGPGWDQDMTLVYVIRCILAMVMNENPLMNEPFFENALLLLPKPIKSYNEVIEYRSLCVGLVDQLRDIHPNFLPMREKMVINFKKNYSKIIERVRQRKASLDGKIVREHYSVNWKLDYTKLEADLMELARELGVEEPSSENPPLRRPRVKIVIVN